jgi:hypothetical protein
MYRLLRLYLSPKINPCGVVNVLVSPNPVHARIYTVLLWQSSVPIPFLLSVSGLAYRYQGSIGTSGEGRFPKTTL